MDDPYLQSLAAVWGKGCSDAADTRPIARRWQREKSVKMMNSLTGKARLTLPADPFSRASEGDQELVKEGGFQTPIVGQDRAVQACRKPRASLKSRPSDRR
jgi:hypothetical protein